MLALARKYRPRNFAAVAVQSHVAHTLKNAIARDRVAHGYLFCGPRGTGKTTLARVLAMALNCPNRTDGEPCGICENCQRIWQGSTSLDVVEIDAASNRGVDDARDLRERAMYAPSSDERYKVYIVDEAHMLTREAWNALLKVLEEPPPRVVFVFATTEPQKIAQAAAPVLSRLQRFDLKRIGPADVRDRLMVVLKEEGIQAHPDALAMIARAADGSMRDALSFTDQVLALGDGEITPERVREALGLVAEDEYLAVLDLVAERRAGDVFPLVDRLANEGVDFGQFLAGMSDMIRAQLAVELGGHAPDVSERATVALAERKGRLGTPDLLRMLNALLEVELRFRKSGQQRALLESLLVRFALLDRTVDLDDLLRAVGGGGSGGGGAPRAAAPERSAAPRMSDREIIAAPVIADRAPPPPAPVAPRRPVEGLREAPPASMEMRAAVAPPPPRAPQNAPPAVPTGTAPVSAPPAASALAEQWGGVAIALRERGRNALGSIVEHAMPVAASASGLLTLEVSDAASQHALEAGADEVLSVVRMLWPGVTRLALKNADDAPATPRRMTADAVRADRTVRLQRSDAVLGAAIEALDLELLD